MYLVYITDQMKSLKIDIPNPCSQNWEEMQPTHHGKMCSNCATTVVDFTTFSNDELTAWLGKVNGERVCGRFHYAQLEGYHREMSPKSSWHSLPIKFLIASSLTFFFNPKANAAKKFEQEYTSSYIKKPSADPIKNAKGKINADSLITITGVVRAADDGSSLPGVWIGTSHSKHHTVTDSQGKFSMQLPSTRNIKLVFKYLGYNNLIKNINIKKNKQLVVLMNTDQTVLGEVVVKKPTRLNKFWWSLKKPFKKGLSTPKSSLFDHHQ